MLKQKLKICDQYVGIYMWLNKVNNKTYIGSSANLSSRLRSHFLGANSNKSLQKDIEKYGISNFIVSILEFIEYDSDLLNLKQKVLEREQYYLNTICNADNPSDEFYKVSYNKNRIAESCLGTKKSEEHKRKLSIAKKGKKLTSEHIKNIKDNHISKMEGYIHFSKIYGTTSKQKEVLKYMSEKNKKAILQYSLDGVFIGEYSSMAEASNKLNISCGNISKNISGKIKTCNGFYFILKHSNTVEDKINIVDKNIIQVFDTNLNIIGEYKSFNSIGKSLNICRSTVSKALKDNNGISTNYIFKYKYENM